MAKNWAIAIGVSQYESQHLRSQPSVQHDVEDLSQAFQAVQFEQVYRFTQTSPNLLLPGSNIVLPTQPTYQNLAVFFDVWFQDPFLSTGDNLWFFFSGCGVRVSDRHYLLPQDANPLAVSRTAFAVGDICNALRCSGADNIILLLDAEQPRGNRDASIIEPEHHAGVVTILAAHPMQPSYARDNLSHGIFASALLKILRSHNQPLLNQSAEPGTRSATIEQFADQLRDCMAEIAQTVGRGPTPQPHITADPPERLHFIIFPEQMIEQDITVLKHDAYRNIQHGSLLFAEQICQRVITVLKPSTSGGDYSCETDCNGQVELPVDLDLMRLHRAIQQRRSTLQGWLFQAEEELSDRAIPLLSLILEDSLTSDRNIDYQPLRDLLIQRDWYAADHETYWVMRQFTRETSEPLTLDEMRQDLQNLLDNPPDDFSVDAREACQAFLQSIQARSPEDLRHLELLIGFGNLIGRTTELENFPQTDLFTLDHLWVKYSQGRFGFSLQKRIYFACGGMNSDTYDQDVWNRFGDRVGWRVNGQWLSGSNSPDESIPDGYFPVPEFNYSTKKVEFTRWWQLAQYT